MQRRDSRAPTVMAMALSSLSLVVLASACGSDPEPLDPTPGETRVVYSCDSGRDFTAVFQAGTERVILEIDGDQLELPQIPAAEGVAYSDGRVTFHAEGTDSFIVGWPGGDFLECSGRNT